MKHNRSECARYLDEKNNASSKKQSPGEETANAYVRNRAKYKTATQLGSVVN